MRICKIISGITTGIILNVKSLFHPLESHEGFKDDLFWEVPDEEGTEQEFNNNPMDEYSDMPFSNIVIPAPDQESGHMEHM